MEVLFLFDFHLQVTTRFICCSSPVIYWYIATITTPEEKLNPISKHISHNNECNLQTDSSSHGDADHAPLYTSSQPIREQDSFIGHDRPMNEQDTLVSSEPMKTQDSSLLSKPMGEQDTSIGQDFDELYDWDSSSFWQKAIFVYFHLFFFVGSAAFPNFLPTTRPSRG